MQLINDDGGNDCFNKPTEPLTLLRWCGVYSVDLLHWQALYLDEANICPVYGASEVDGGRIVFRSLVFRETLC